MESSATVRPTKDSMDPLFHLVFDVHELVLQHFDASDVLRASLVSRTWFEVTESSSKCGERLLLIMEGVLGEIVDLRLKFDIPSKFETITDDFKSVRKYQRVEFGSFEKNIIFMIPHISNVFKRWKLKKVGIHDVHFKNVEQMENFLSIFASTVETLKLANIDANCSYNNDNPRNKILDFPVLKHLIIHEQGQWTFLVDISDSCKSLESLNVSLPIVKPNHDDKIVNFIKEILTRNDNLTDLRVNVRVYTIGELLSPEAISSYRFRLKTLSVMDIRGLDHFPNFLKSQMETLEELYFEFWDDPRELFKTILELPKIKKLQLSIKDSVVYPAAWVDEQLCQSSSIEEFALKLSKDLEFAFSHTALSLWLLSMPNLKKFYINTLTHEHLEILKIPLRKIEHLWVDRLSIRTLKDPNCLPNIKRFYCEHPIDDELKSQIEAKSVESRTPFEKLLLDHTVSTWVSNKIFGPPKIDEKYEWLYVNPFSRLSYHR